MLYKAEKLDTCRCAFKEIFLIQFYVKHFRQDRYITTYEYRLISLEVVPVLANTV